MMNFNFEYFHRRVLKLYSLFETVEKRGIFSPLSIELMDEAENILNGFKKLMRRLQKISTKDETILDMINIIEGIMPMLEDIEYFRKIRRESINKI